MVHARDLPSYCTLNIYFKKKGAPGTCRHASRDIGGVIAATMTTGSIKNKKCILLYEHILFIIISSSDLGNAVLIPSS